MSSNSGAHHHSEGELGHILPVSVYITTLILLLVLTVITVAVAQVNFSLGGINLNFLVAMVIASIKAGIVCCYFMHIKYENPIIWGCIGVPVFLIFVMLAGLFIDNPLREESKFISEVKSEASE